MALAIEKWSGPLLELGGFIMKHIVLSPVKVETHIEKITDTSSSQAPQDEGLMDECFDDLLYGDSRVMEQEVKNTDLFDKYTISSEQYMTLKEARVSKEIKTPFSVIKGQTKTSKVTEYDNIYRTDKKIKYKQYRQGFRLGFIRGADNFRYSNINLKKDSELVGMLNEEIPIRKKKGFNQKTVGFMKLSEGTDYKDYFVEVTKSRGILWMIVTALIVAALLILLHGHDWSGWHFNLDGLTAYKTITTELTKEEVLMDINHRASVDLEENKLNIDLKSNEVTNRQFKIKIYVGNDTDGVLIYESGMMEAGESLETIEIREEENLEAGNYNCTIICDVYKGSGGYLGSLESYFTMRK